jgi:hypothetical protein
VEVSHQGEVGNAMQTSLTEVWSGESFARFREDRIPFCRRCSSPRNMTLGLRPDMCRQFRD